MTKLLFDPNFLAKELAVLHEFVPDSVYTGISPILSGELHDVVTEDRKYIVSRQTQLGQLVKDASSDTEGVYIFTGNNFATRARHAALLFAAARLRFGHLGQRFFRWHQLSYGTNETGLTHEYFTLRPQILVIDSVYDNSSIITIEKVRGLINKYNPPVTIITGAGGCPVDIAHKRLNIEVARVLRFK